MLSSGLTELRRKAGVVNMNQMEGRIYKKKVDISGMSVHDLFNKRAKTLAKSEKTKYMTVLLGDQNPDYAKEWNQTEKDLILPKLELTKKNHFLDIGCGIGRYAEFVAPLVGVYTGIDFSEEMIKTAKSRVSLSDPSSFKVGAFQNIDELVPNQKFDRCIVSYICMYLNDDELKQSFAKLLSHLEDHAIVYFIESIANQDRLTLNNVWSKAMKTNYEAIYRTTDEYNELYKVFTDAGFEVAEQSFAPHLNKEKEFSETDRWYTILKR